MMTLRFFMLFLQRQYSYILLNHEQKWAFHWNYGDFFALVWNKIANFAVNSLKSCFSIYNKNIKELSTLPDSIN